MCMTQVPGFTGMTEPQAWTSRLGLRQNCAQTSYLGDAKPWRPLPQMNPHQQTLSSWKSQQTVLVARALKHAS